MESHSSDGLELGLEQSLKEKIKKLADICALGTFEIDSRNVLESLFLKGEILTPEEMKGYHYGIAYDRLSREQRIISEKVDKNVGYREPGHSFSFFGGSEIYSFLDEQRYFLEKNRNHPMRELNKPLDNCINTSYYARCPGVDYKVLDVLNLFSKAYFESVKKAETFDEKSAEVLFFGVEGVFEHLDGRMKFYVANEFGRSVSMLSLREKCYEAFGELLLKTGGSIESYDGKKELYYAFSQMKDSEDISEISACLCCLYEVADYWKRKAHENGKDEIWLTREEERRTVNYNLQLLFEDMKMFGWRDHGFLSYTDWSVSHIGVDEFSIVLGSGVSDVRSGHINYRKKDHLCEDGLCREKISSDNFTLIASENGHPLQLLNEDGEVVFYEELLSDENLNPLKKDPESLSQMLRSFHYPVYKHSIERALGVKYQEMPLRQQLWLLHFLETRSSNDIGTLGSFLKYISDEERQKVLQSFVTCSLNVDMGNLMLDLFKKRLIYEMKPIWLFHEIKSDSLQLDLRVGEFLSEDARIFIKKSIEETHRDVSPVIGEYFLRSFQESCLKGSQDFYCILKKDSGEVLGTARYCYKEDGKAVKVGSLYLDESVQKDFSVGVFMRLARDMMLPNDNEQHALVALNNPKWETHIKSGGIAYALDFINNEPLLKFCYHSQESFGDEMVSTSKDIQDIENQLEGGYFLTEIDGDSLLWQKPLDKNI